jgi:hypothetical protein
MLEITTKNFYIIGMVSFFIIAITGIINFIIYFAVNNIWSKIGGAFTIIFNIAVALFFYYLLSLEPKIESIAGSDDIDEIIKEMNKGDKKK